MNTPNWIGRSVSMLLPNAKSTVSKPKVPQVPVHGTSLATKNVAEDEPGKGGGGQAGGRARRPHHHRAAGGHPQARRRGVDAARPAPPAGRTAGGDRSARQRGRGRTPRPGGGGLVRQGIADRAARRLAAHERAVHARPRQGPRGAGAVRRRRGHARRSGRRGAAAARHRVAPAAAVAAVFGAGRRHPLPGGPAGRAVAAPEGQPAARRARRRDGIHVLDLV